MKEYRKNEVSRDIFYEEQKREQMKDAVTKEMNDQRQAEQDALEADDPWMRSKFDNAQESTETPTEPASEEPSTTVSEEPSTTVSEEPSTEPASEPSTNVTEEQSTTVSEEPIEKVI